MAEQNTLPATIPWSREVVEEIARDIGDAVLAHVETMYPSAIQATPSTFKISLRNCVRNEIIAAVSVNDAVQAIARIRERKRFRRKTRANFSRMRNASPAHHDGPDED
jgi:hypothetical protein